jgi:hypothetical protein
MPPSFHPYAEKPMDTGMEGWKEPSKRPFTPIIHTLHSLPPHSPPLETSDGRVEGGVEGVLPPINAPIHGRFRSVVEGWKEFSIL